MTTRALILVTLAAGGALAPAAGAQEITDPRALARESEAYCASTAAGAPVDPAVVIAKVDEAIALLQAEGTSAFPKFQGRGSPFLFAGTYVWVHTRADCVMLMHPIKPELVGRRLMGLRDAAGKRFFVAMNKVVREEGAGWVQYLWPQPGTGEVVRKISYVKGCRIAGGLEVAVGCGLYSVEGFTVAGLTLH